MSDIEAAAYDDPDAPVIVLSPKNPCALAVIQAIYKSPYMPIMARLEAAKACLPYEFKRQPIGAAMTHEGGGFIAWLERLSELRHAGVYAPLDDPEADEPDEPEKTGH